jgi:transposase InsO family protein
LHLAIILDLYMRQIVGWAMRERMIKELVIDALRRRGSVIVRLRG